MCFDLGLLLVFFLCNTCVHLLSLHLHKTAFNLNGYDYDFLTPEQGTSYDDSKPPWTFVADQKSHEIQITLYIEHPLFTYAKKGGEKILTKIAQIDVFCQMMQDKSHSVAEIQAKRETLYREAFGG